jgi:DNA polymerase-1
MANFVYFGTNNSLGKDVLYERLVSKSSGAIAIDVETVGLDDRRLIGIGFSITPTDNYYFPWDSPMLPLGLLKNPNVTKVIHNGHFDLQVIKETWDIDVNPIVDTLIGAQILGHPPALGTLSEKFFDIHIPSITSIIGKGKGAKTMDQVPLEVVAFKCCLDVKCSLLLWEKIKGDLPKEAFDLDMRVLPVIMSMEDRGMLIDQERLDKHIADISKDVNYYKSVAMNGYGFNPGSGKQLAAILQSRGYYIHYKKETGNPVMNNETIQMLYADDPLAQLSSMYKKKRVLLSNTLKPIKDKFLGTDGRVHSRFHQNLVSTGRLSSSKPNSMNLTESLRDIIIPAEGRVIEDWDLSQIELRVLAYIAQDTTMMKIFEEGGDIHEETSDFIFGDHDPGHRRTSKDINFAIVYGGDAYTLYEKSRVPLEVGEVYIERYFQKFPNIRRWIEDTRKFAHENGYTQTLLGRRRSHADIHSPVGYRSAKAERELINHPIQGSAAEILKELLYRLRGEPQINAMHDSSVMERELDKLPDYGVLDGLAPFKTPAKVKLGFNWKDLTEVGSIGT